MNQSLKPKTCSKNYKTAELKLQKIINKIDSLKLSTSYVARLDVRKSANWSLVKRKSLVYLLSSVVVTLLSLFSAQWISLELIGQTVRLIIIVNKLFAAARLECLSVIAVKSIQCPLS